MQAGGGKGADLGVKQAEQVALGTDAYGGAAKGTRRHLEAPRQRHDRRKRRTHGDRIGVRGDVSGCQGARGTERRMGASVRQPYARHAGAAGELSGQRLRESCGQEAHKRAAVAVEVVEARARAVALVVAGDDGGVEGGESGGARRARAAGCELRAHQQAAGCERTRWRTTMPSQRRRRHRVQRALRAAGYMRHRSLAEGAAFPRLGVAAVAA